LTCKSLDEGEQFWCAGNLYTMLIPRDETSCFEAVLETIEPGHVTPPNAHMTFVQMYFFVEGSARVHIGSETCEIKGPAVAYVPIATQHHVENIGEGALSYIYVSIWPGEIPEGDGRTWREACNSMIEAYASQGYSPRHS
jgi:mannose-6-phosphate isomerase-like protein (cupin superfamily)